MSGQPSQDGVRQLLSAMEELEAVMRRLEAAVPERDRLIAEVNGLDSKRLALSARLKGLLSEMDADSPGNYGWEGRFAWLLTEFRRQVLSRAGSP